MADRKMGNELGRKIFLSTIFLSAIFLSAIFLSEACRLPKSGRHRPDSASKPCVTVFQVTRLLNNLALVMRASQDGRFLWPSSCCGSDGGVIPGCESLKSLRACVGLCDPLPIYLHLEAASRILGISHFAS